MHVSSQPKAKIYPKSERRRWLPIVILLIILPSLLGGPTVDAKHLWAQVNPGDDWRDTGLPWVAHEQPLCFDTSQPFVVLVNEQDIGTVAYNWSTSQRTRISERYFQVCGPRGLLYQPTEAGAWRYDLTDPVGQAIDHLPTHVAYDGSLTVYTLANSRLWASQDGGFNWEERTAPIGEAFEGTLLVSEADAQAIYAVVYQVSPTPSGTAAPRQVLVFSSNGGRTWEESVPANPPPTDRSGPSVTNRWDAMPGASAPVNFLLRTSYTDCCGPGSIGIEVWLSSDGGRSLMRPSLGKRTARSIVQIVNTPQGIIRYHWVGLSPYLDRSSDGGQTWELLKPPRNPYYLGAARGVPGVIFVDTAGAVASQGGDLIYSLDSGNTWHKVTDYTDFTVWDRTGGSNSYTPYRLDVTPYLPITLLGVKDGRMHALQLPVDGSGLLAPALPDRNPGVLHFPETGHNMRGTFADYWASHGGLAQQGYPLTEPFEQVSDVDGKIYLIQYFERAVFELHPENQPPFNVLLSLLGTQTYKQKYGPSGAPNQHVSDDNPLYFPQTGNTIGGRFRRYWEEHGGLAQQGYPISNEFQEVSTIDGKTYTVQYFERAIFEYHPENAGTPYEVLLSPLGVAKTKDLLRQVPPR